MRLNTSLNTLHPYFRTVAVELIAKMVEAKIPIQIINTKRTQSQAKKLLLQGRSWTKNSKHLIGHAIDLAPFEIYKLHGPDKLNWDRDDPIWQEMGDIGRRIGLVWGGDWLKKDMGHFEFPTILA